MIQKTCSVEVLSEMKTNEIKYISISGFNVLDSSTLIF